MSESFDLVAAFGVPSKLCFSSVFSVSAPWSTLSFLPTVSMRFRLKRTCSGVECFGGYHINRLFKLSCFPEVLLSKTSRP